MCACTRVDDATDYLLPAQARVTLDLAASDVTFLFRVNKEHTRLEMLVRRAGGEDISSHRPIAIDFEGHALAGPRPIRAFGMEAGKWVFTVALVDTSYGDLS